MMQYVGFMKIQRCYDSDANAVFVFLNDIVTQRRVTVSMNVALFQNSGGSMTSSILVHGRRSGCTF